MAAGTSVKLVIPSELKLVDLVHAASEKMAELAGFDDEEALNLGLAVREAVINAMLHGNQQDLSLDVNVTLTSVSGGLEAVVWDQGNGFDPDATPDPTQGSNVLRTTGRGLMLIRAFVDKVEIKRHARGGTQVTMTKRLPSKDKT